MQTASCNRLRSARRGLCTRGPVRGNRGTDPLREPGTDAGGESDAPGAAPERARRRGAGGGHAAQRDTRDTLRGGSGGLPGPLLLRRTDNAVGEGCGPQHRTGAVRVGGSWGQSRYFSYDMCYLIIFTNNVSITLLSNNRNGMTAERN